MEDEMAEVDEFLRLGDVLKASGKGRTALYAAVARGEFPSPLKLSEGGRAVAWLKSEVIAWQQRQVALRDAMLSTKASRLALYHRNESVA
jgi:prophage regulatory protein